MGVYITDDNLAKILDVFRGLTEAVWELQDTVSNLVEEMEVMNEGKVPGKSGGG